VNPLDELTRALPKPPASEELPRQLLHKTELLTIIAADRRRALRNRVNRRWLVPAMAAAAVATIAVLALTVPNLVGIGAGNVPANRGARSSHPTSASSEGGAAPTATGSRLTTRRHWSVRAARFSAIAVTVDRGSVVVVGGAASSAAVTAAPHYVGRAPVLSSQVLDGTLAVTASCPQEPDCQVALTLRVPAAVAVRVTADLGDVTLTGLSGAVTASTKAGMIGANDLLAAQVVLSSQDGDITAAFAVPPAHVSASSQLGDVTLRLPETVTYDVIASTKLGSTSITAPRSARSGHVIKASSQLGSVTVAGVLIRTTVNL
jgi:hypothetical protein